MPQQKPSKVIISAAALLLAGGVAYMALGSAKDETRNEVTGSLDVNNTNIATSTGTGLQTRASPAAYKNGTYSSSVTYRTPQSVEPFTATLTLKDDVITEVSISASPVRPESKQYQDGFISAYKQYVVGKNIKDLIITRVSGASLTTGAFNRALENIRSEAKA